MQDFNFLEFLKTMIKKLEENKILNDGNFSEYQMIDCKIKFKYKKFFFKMWIYLKRLL